MRIDQAPDSIDPPAKRERSRGLRALSHAVLANRRLFDTRVRGFGVNRAHLDAVEDALAEAGHTIAQLQAEVAAYRTSTSWRLTRPVRQVAEFMARLHRRSPAAPPPVPPPTPPRRPPSYAEWIATTEPSLHAALIEPSLGRGPVALPRLGLVLFGARHAARPWPVPTVLATPDALPGALDRLPADLVCLLDDTEDLAPAALDLVQAAAAREPGLAILFGDEDWLATDGTREHPFFKPGWSPELQLGRDLIGPAAFYRKDLLRAAVPSATAEWRYDLANQVAELTGPGTIRHLPAVLCHRRAAPSADALRAAAGRHLRRAGLRGRAEAAPAPAQGHRIAYDLPDPPPLVSVIVPTRDRADLLAPCAEALRGTDYPALDVIVVDNGSTEPDALALLAQLEHAGEARILRYAAPFNWAAINNAAARIARGRVLLLLNNDVALVRPDWLRELVALVMQPGIGAAGPKLLYPDGSIQHAGITTDERGFPRHLLRHAAGDGPGPFGLLALPRDVWGVTGACMAVRRDAYDAVGGFNEALPVACNDVDFNLRLAAAGYRIVWTPCAVLEHRELASRAPDHAPARREAAAEEMSKLQREWGPLVQFDPFLHPALELIDEQPWFRIGPVSAERR